MLLINFTQDILFFFFSSRRRHTRCGRDWSSDVCSSDLAVSATQAISAAEAETARAQKVNLRTPPETPPGANYFVDMVAGDLRRILGSSSGDLTLRTTLNLELQRLAEGVIERRLEQEGAEKKVS